MASELTIRPYVEGRDETAYVDLYNRANAGMPEYVPLTLQEYELECERPDYDRQGRFIAEWNGTPAGSVHAFVDPKRVEQRGILRGPCVLPDMRRRKVGTALLDAARQDFIRRGALALYAMTEGENEPARRFFTAAGLKEDRVLRRMARWLTNLPEGVGENHAVRFRELGSSDNDLTLRNRLLNESLNEQYLFRPEILDETRYQARMLTRLGVAQGQYVGLLNGDPVGIILTRVKPVEFKYIGRERGWIVSFGVLREFRGRGIGKALLLHAMEQLREQGLEEAALVVDEHGRLRLVRLCEYFGFHPRHKQTWYFGELDHGLSGLRGPVAHELIVQPVKPEAEVVPQPFVEL